MRYAFYRLLREWYFWFCLFLCVVLIVGYTYTYNDNGETRKHEWDYEIAPYSSKEELKFQIETNKENVSVIQEMLASGEIVNDEQTQAGLKKLNDSIVILEYLYAHADEYSYDSVCDGSFSYAYAKDARSYGIQAMEVIFLFQLAAIVFIIGRVVNQDKTTGAFAATVIMRGRKELFLRQLIVSLAVFTIGYIIQIVMVGVIRPMFGAETEYVLFYNGTKITVLSHTTEYLVYCVSTYVILLFYWAVSFLLSQVIDNVFTFTVSALLVIGGVMCSIMFFDVPGVVYVNSMLIDFFDTEKATGFLAGVHCVRFVLTVVSLLAAYHISQKKNYSLKYE